MQQMGFRAAAAAASLVRCCVGLRWLLLSLQSASCCWGWGSSSSWLKHCCNTMTGANSSAVVFEV
jgi:hypothetical protein